MRTLNLKSAQTTQASIVVLISGRGSNLNALCCNGLSNNISVVISNNPVAPGLEIAKSHGIITHIIDHRQFKSKNDFEQHLAGFIDNFSPKLIVLAGFMRILGAEFIKRYPNKIINIHPSILPSFVGTNAQLQTLNFGCKVGGATVHFVTANLDGGPIIAQGVVPIKNEDDITTFSDSLLKLEHCIYPFVVKKFLDNAVTIDINGKVNTVSSAKDVTILGKFAKHIFY
jgi:phosphoribosylglycinamide formyltransferase 1